MEKIGIIILAAGKSSRMGTPKQNLVYQDETLLNRSIRMASESNASNLLVVLGAFAESIEKKKEVHYILNSNWNQGMGSSVALGMREILNKTSQLSGVLLMLCDQPFVTKELLNQLIKTFHQQTAEIIVACEYEETIGVPVLFGKKWFEELQRLGGKMGAQKIIRTHLQETIKVPFPQGKWDIDTPERYQALVTGNLEIC